MIDKSYKFDREDGTTIELDRMYGRSTSSHASFRPIQEYNIKVTDKDGSSFEGKVFGTIDEDYLKEYRNR